MYDIGAIYIHVYYVSKRQRLSCSNVEFEEHEPAILIFFCRNVSPLLGKKLMKRCFVFQSHLTTASALPDKPSATCTLNITLIGCQLLTTYRKRRIISSRNHILIASYCEKSVCGFVCSRAYLRNHTTFLCMLPPAVAR